MTSPFSTLTRRETFARTSCGECAARGRPDARLRLRKNNPQAAEPQRLGARFGRALGSGDATASGYIGGVSGGFRQVGNNAALSRALLSVGTLIQGDGPARASPFRPMKSPPERGCSGGRQTLGIDLGVEIAQPQ
jgi:hypothetical protein